LVIGYVAFHAYLYHNCIFPPGILEWPGACL
jgi:hypothetical protein